MFLLQTLRDGFKQLREVVNNNPLPVVSVPSGPTSIDMQSEMPFLHEQMRVYAGVSHLRRSAFHDNFTGETREMRLKYRYALAEPAVKAALIGKIINVCSLSLQVKAKDRHNPRDKEVADCVKHAIEASEYGLTGVLWDMLSGGLMDGWSVCEPVWKTETRGKWRGYRVLENFKGKDTRYIQPEVDPYLNITGLYSLRGNAGRRFDPKQYVVFSYLSFFQNPTGMSDLRASYRAIEMLPALIRMRMVFLEKFVGPFLAGTLKDRSLRERMRAELAKARAEGFVVLDEGSDVKILNLATSSTSEYQAAITDLRQEVAIGISGAFLHMLTGETPGARGNSEIQQETTQGFVWMLADQASNRLKRQLAPHIVDNNFGAQTDIPDITLEAVNPADIVADLNIDEKLHGMGLPLSRDELYDRARRTSPMSVEDTLKGAEPQNIGNTPDSPYSMSSLAGSQNGRQQTVDTFADRALFTGVITDKRGAKRKYVSGKEVAMSDEQPPERKRGSVDAGGDKSKSKGKRSIEQKPDSDKVARAKANHVLIGKDVQRYAEERNEPWVAKQLGGVSFPDSEPVDVSVPGESGVMAHGVELKTLVSNGNFKLTMDSYSQIRKLLWEQAQKGAVYHTIVLDDQDVYDPGGNHKDLSNRVYYYRRGVAGSARVAGMQKCKDMDEVKKLMAMDEKQLPEAAQRTDGALRIGKWKAFTDAQGKGFRNQKTGQVVRAKK